MRTVLVLLVVWPSIARAQFANSTPTDGMLAMAPKTAPEPKPTDASFALAVNPPFRWASGGAFGGSVYVGWKRHFAVRANFAAYDAGNPGELVGALLHAEDEGSYSGRIYDGGISAMWFPRALWDGFTVETGLLVRKRDHATVEDSAAPHLRVDTDTMAYGARALIGWSWLFEHHLFVSIAVGASWNRERGTVTYTDDPVYMRPPQTRDVDRRVVDGEAFMRFGGVLDI